MRAATSSDPTPNAPAVEQAYAAIPATMIGEILDGELHVLPRPRPRHARATTRLVRTLGPFDDDPGEPGGWVLLVEPELHLGPKPDKIVPDLVGCHRDRLPAAVFEEGAAGALTIAPDWACEVLSEGTERLDRGVKMRIYRREGVRHVWLLSPSLETLEVYRLDAGRWTLLDTFEGDAVVHAEPFEALPLALGALFAK